MRIAKDSSHNPKPEKTNNMTSVSKTYNRVPQIVNRYWKSLKEKKKLRSER